MLADEGVAKKLLLVWFLNVSQMVISRSSSALLRLNVALSQRKLYSTERPRLRAKVVAGEWPMNNSNNWGNIHEL